MSGLTRYNYPFTNTFDNIFKDFDSVFMPLSFRSTKPQTVDNTPRANVYYKDDEGYSIEIAVPGYTRDDFNIDVENGVLTVGLNGTTEDTVMENKNVRRREWSYSSFNRSFTLPEQTEVDQISARYDAGILHVTVPTAQEIITRKQITVQ